MKSYIKITTLLILLLAGAGCSSDHYVSAQPDAVVVERPVRPGPNYIWVDGDYYYRGGRYNYRQGYWAAPRRGRIWAPGTWQHNNRGYYWKRGGWRR